ncbi:MAG: hypothetical protein KGH61_02975 [Candidatus Micrarchaeota archaeon]|nr:hypothetical protein [Candidatus Micrarchaeota archaeon]MDE1847886.1 hypothetical protein [Candidatus Micrarchaeota archaeon]MDE1864512.1 hypothetical protein [Candidatus Micrarchaeota archaeon]
MNYTAYTRRRRTEMMAMRIKLQKLFSMLHYEDFEKVQKLLQEAEGILQKYETN